MTINFVVKKPVSTGRLFKVFIRNLVILIIFLIFTFTAKSQSIIEEAFVPIIDSNGMVVGYIKKTSLGEYQNPTPLSKIWAYDVKLNLVGYWQGTRKKFFKMKTKH